MHVAWRQHYPVVRAGRSSRGGSRFPCRPLNPGRPDPASSPERCTIAWRQHYPVADARRTSSGGERRRGVPPRVRRRPGPRLLAGAMHVAWRQRYPGDRTGRCCVLGTGVSAPSSSAETRTPPPRRGGARSVEAALPGRPCGKQFRAVACRYARTVCDGDRRVGSIHFPSVPDPAFSPERCT